MLVTNLDESWAVLHGLQLCTQNALDIATHLCAALGRDAQDYRSAIDGLVALGVLPPEFGSRFRDVAGFRNILVHGYLEVDLRRVHTLLN
ncbi:MAG: type VII toxin-antitoxin system HepT family RNase toxin, partial [Myxococcota bacterium]